MSFFLLVIYSVEGLIVISNDVINLFCQMIMKRRQKRFNYGQRCTPVSLDAYSLDSVSIYNSVRRKGMRASKRSYGNAAFDDPVGFKLLIGSFNKKKVVRSLS